MTKRRQPITTSCSLLHSWQVGVGVGVVIPSLVHSSCEVDRNMTATSNSTATTTTTVPTSSTNSSSPRQRQPIGPEDIVAVQGRYLVTRGKEGNNHEQQQQQQQQRFLMQGMAFPIAPASHDKRMDNYDAAGWIAVLEQLAADTDINTVRIYELDCRQPRLYESFLQRAADLGIYVLIPLTTVSGKGVLNRNRRAPHCYNQTLYDYGRTCMDLMNRHANILAGLIGNEVMNSLETWPAAPCIQAYARDLKLYTANQAVTAGWRRTQFPLIYAAQHDSPTASVLPNDAMKLTQQYLACRHDDGGGGGSHSANDEPYVDIFGINVESWCSSLQTFAYEEDGTTESQYHALYETLRQTAAIPVVFTEMGCSQALFNRDNGLPQIRDWHQVPAVLQDMVDTWSGFCAYTYDGNVLFRMMNGTWNGHDVLAPTADYDNFRHALHHYQESVGLRGGVHGQNQTLMTIMERPSCEAVRRQILNDWKVNLYPLERMPSYYVWESYRTLRVVLATTSVVVLFVLAAYYYCRRRSSPNQKTMENGVPTETDSLLSNKA